MSITYVAIFIAPAINYQDEWKGSIILFAYQIKYDIGLAVNKELQSIF